MFFSPIRNDPKKTHKQIFGTHPVPGQSRKFFYVCVFFLSLIISTPNLTGLAVEKIILEDSSPRLGGVNNPPHSPSKWEGRGMGLRDKVDI